MTYGCAVAQLITKCVSDIRGEAGVKAEAHGTAAARRDQGAGQAGARGADIAGECEKVRVQAFDHGCTAQRDSYVRVYTVMLEAIFRRIFPNSI